MNWTASPEIYSNFKTQNNMKRSISIILALLLFSITARAQLSLGECQRLARENYPLIRQYELIDRLAAYDMQNARRAWLPQISISGQASYQSDVTSFPSEISELYDRMGISLNPLNKDQYHFSLDVQQIIWDGGATKAQAEAIEAQKNIDLLSNETELYALRERINQIYFGILTLVEQEKQLELKTRLLKDNLSVLEGASKSGAALETDIYMIEAEILVNAQQHTRISSTKAAYLQVLGLMTGREYGADTQFAIPELPEPGPAENLRPELQLFDARLHALDAQDMASSAAVMPKFSLYAQGLYGNPGLNMFQDMMEYKWSWNYIVGLRFQWNISSLFTHRNNRRKTDLGRSMVEVQRERFLYENNLQQSRQREAIAQMEAVMKDDDRIIELRAKLREASEQKWKNGVITTSELLKDIANESNAKLEKSIHELEWLRTIYELDNLTNN